MVDWKDDGPSEESLREFIEKEFKVMYQALS